MTQGASSEILTEIRDTDLNEDATWEILQKSNCPSSLNKFWDVFLDDADVL